MDRQFAEVLITGTTNEQDLTQLPALELNELQLALVGGGIGDTVL